MITLVRRLALRRFRDLLGVGVLVACQQSRPPTSAASGPAASGPAASGPAGGTPTAAAGSPLPPAVAPAPSAPAAAVPATAQLGALESLICFGNEPFWGVEFKADGSATCEAMCEGPVGLHVVNLSLAPSGDPQGFDLVDAQGGLFLHGVLRKTGKCSDGMSDNLHPYVFTGQGERSLEGCCRDKRAQLPSG